MLGLVWFDAVAHQDWRIDTASRPSRRSTGEEHLGKTNEAVLY